MTWEKSDRDRGGGRDGGRREGGSVGGQRRGKSSELVSTKEGRATTTVREMESKRE